MLLNRIMPEVAARLQPREIAEERVLGEVPGAAGMGIVLRSSDPSVDLRVTASSRAGPERRASPRIVCPTATALVVVGRHTIPLWVTDLSPTGIRLFGRDLPMVGAWISLSIVIPPRELMAAGHVTWSDGRGAIGVQLATGSPHHQQELAEAILAVTADLVQRRPTIIDATGPRLVGR